MATEEEIQEEIELIQDRYKQEANQSRQGKDKSSIVALGIAGALIAGQARPAVKVDVIKLGHSDAEKILKGTPYLQSGEHQGNIIKEVIKSDWDNKRVVKFTDGTKVNTNKDVVRASVDVELDKVYKPKALATLKEAKTVPTTKVKLGGPKEGETVKYASKANAKRAVDNYYSGDFQQYKRGEYPQRCKKK